MKHDRKLKDLLIGTGACLLLTLFQFLKDSVHPTYRGYREGLTLIILWLVVIASWAIYLIRLFRKRQKEKEEEPWNKKVQDPW